MQRYIMRGLVSDMKKDVSIQMIRILSMSSIILCHLVQELNNSTIAKTGQLFNVGVYIFLFLSGWLYGQKDIQDVFEWLFGRIKRVLAPMWLFMLFLFGIHTYQGTMQLKYIPIYLTDTQYWLGKMGGGTPMVCKCYFPLLSNYTTAAGV